MSARVQGGKIKTEMMIRKEIIIGKKRSRKRLLVNYFICQLLSFSFVYCWYFYFYSFINKKKNPKNKKKYIDKKKVQKGERGERNNGNNGNNYFLCSTYFCLLNYSLCYARLLDLWKEMNISSSSVFKK